MVKGLLLCSIFCLSLFYHFVYLLTFLLIRGWWIWSLTKLSLRTDFTSVCINWCWFVLNCVIDLVSEVKLFCFRNRCENKTLCMEKLSLVLPDRPPYIPRQFGRCAVIGNSGDLLKTKFGKEIDGYDVIIRENGAPIQVAIKWCHFPQLSINLYLLSLFSITISLFRTLQNTWVRKAHSACSTGALLRPLIKLQSYMVIHILVLRSSFHFAHANIFKSTDKGKEVLIVKTTIHDIMTKMIRVRTFVMLLV